MLIEIFVEAPVNEMEKEMRLLAFVTFVVLLAGCENGHTVYDSPEQEVRDVRTLSLVRVDSIGIEMGDSVYVMGAIEGVAYGPAGNIAVLDCARSCLRIYSPEGEFLRRIGRQGNGPGELQSVAFLAISEDGHVFMAGEGSSTLGLHVFNYETGEWLSSESTLGTPPTCIEGADGSAHVRKDIELDVSSGDPVVLVSIARYEFGMEDPEVIYFEDSFPFDPTEMGRLIDVIWGGYDIATNFSGNVYVAPRSTEEALVYAYTPDGSERFILELDLDPVERTEEEMEMERMILRMHASAMDMEQMPLEPDPYKPLIRGLEVDGEGNLWVLRGDPAIPTFEVFDGNGEFLYNAVVEGDPQDGSTWKFFIDGNGILAYAEDPACGYQKVYMLEVRE